MKTILKISTIVLMTLISNIMFGQSSSVTIGGTETISDAVLWLIPSGNDGNQGLVLPQVERSGFEPSMQGMIIFDPTDQTIYLWDGIEWQGMGSGGSGSADDWGEQTVVTDSVLIGEGTILNPLSLASQGAQVGQILKWDGTSWTPAIDETGAGGSSVNSTNEIIGDGTVGNPLQLSDQGAVVGQILKWDGTSWAPAEDLNGDTGTSYFAGAGIEIDADNNIINSGDPDADPTNEFQTLSFDVATNELSLSDGNTISIPTGGTDADADPTNEIQTITFNDVTNELSLSDGGTVVIPSGTADADADPTNEIQDLTLTGTTLNISDGTGVDLAPLIPPGGTDDQNLELTGDVLSIEGGVGTVDLSIYGDDADADPTNEIQTITYNLATNELSLTDGGTVTIAGGGADADADPTNEIQDLTLSGTTIEISGGTGVDIAALIPPGGTDDQDLIMTGDVLSIEGGAGAVDLSAYGDDADADPTNEIQTIDYNVLTGEVSLTDGGSFTLPASGSGAFESVGGIVRPSSVNDDDFVFGSDQLENDVTTEDDNKRMFFDKSKGAFRAGNSGAGNSWDDINVASGSVAMGINNEASGTGSVSMGENNHAEGYTSMAIGFNNEVYGLDGFVGGAGSVSNGAQSFAFGNSTEASADQSTALGSETTASAQNSTALGLESTASGLNSTAIGNATTASGINSTSMGVGTLASGDNATAMGGSTTASGSSSTAMGAQTEAIGDLSTVMGHFSSATGDRSVAMGHFSSASGSTSIAMGHFSTSSGDRSTAMGHHSTALGDKSTACGFQTDANSFNGFALGRYNIGNGTEDSWIDTDPLFEIGNGDATDNRSNAITILKNGRVGITESEPSTDLVVGSNFPFNSSATVPLVTIGGSEREGGALVVGQEDKNVWVQSTESGSVILSRETGLPDNIGDLNISARTLRVGTNGSSNLYKMDIRQSGPFGLHLSLGTFGWEHAISNTTGNLLLFTDASAPAIGFFNQTSGAYSAMSDRNSKEDVKSMGSVLSKVNQLEPLRYQFIGAQDDKKSLGFIAQDVQEIFPELVTYVEGREGGEGRHLMDYSGFGVIAIAAIQEQQEEIEDLKNIIEELMKRVECLEK